MLKRSIDVVAAVFGLLVLGIPLLVAMLIVRLTSPGPAIFAQTRVGHKGKEFVCYKLRSMYLGTASVPTTEVGASAITPVGSLLRRTKLDEIPQLWNVLNGTMSLVGPRPCLPTQTALIAARRATGAFDVRPGITGLAQIQNIDMSTAQWLADVDGDYVRTQSFLLDIRILLATISGKGLWIDPARR